MRIEMNKENIEDDLTALVLVSHGGAAIGTVDSIQLIFGKQKNFVGIAFEMGDDATYLYEKLREVYELFHGNCIFFADLLGGSPCNQLQLLSLKLKVKGMGLVGFNIPMILTAVENRNSGLSKEQIIEKTMEGGLIGIQKLEIKENLLEEDDE